MFFAGQGMVVIKRHGVDLTRDDGSHHQTDEQEGNHLIYVTRNTCRHNTPLGEGLMLLLFCTLCSRALEFPLESYREACIAVKEGGSGSCSSPVWRRWKKSRQKNCA